MINMKDQCFGLELEFTGMTREQAAREIGKFMEGYVSYAGGTYKAWTVTDIQGRKWTVESDASIETERCRDGSWGEKCEFVTPKCTYEDIGTIQEIVRTLRRAGAKVNKSCGIHIHIDGANHTTQSMKNLVFTFRAKEDLIFKAVGTQRSRLEKWCKPIDDELVGEIKKSLGQ